jgi:ABC-type polysaccharide/polyol phosphate transport system ATPase subunit
MSDLSRPAVVVDDVSKTYSDPREHVHTLKERVLHPFRRTRVDTMRALHDVSFAVERGEFFGIVGRNGSGKSTLLKCLAGIYATDSGRMYIDGRMSTFIELGVGFNPDLAAYDNVMLNATMLGLEPKEARQRFDRIVAFAELEEFTELKIKNYSSGMLVRLAFSVMIQVDADVLLIDEVLAVGDAAFQQKCFDEFARIRDRGTTVLLVTHDMSAVERFCHRALLLERGEVVEIGEPREVGARYVELNFSRRARAEIAGVAANEEAESTADMAELADTGRLGDGRAEILEAWVETEHGRDEHLPHGEPFTFAARIRFHEDVENPLFGVDIFNDRGDHITAANNSKLAGSGRFSAGDVVVVRIAFDALMAPGRYYFTVAVAQSGTGLAWLDRRERFVSAIVTGAQDFAGLVPLPFTLTLERIGRDLPISTQP